MSRNRNNGVSLFETLEGRTMMSAVLTHAAGATPKAVTLSNPAVDGNVVKWKNFSNDPLFAPGGPSMNDIQQGYVGDCWFVSSLAEVALRDPSLIRQDIIQRPDHTYDVFFHTSPTTTVDEHVNGMLPMRMFGQLEYARLGKHNCTWVAIMEKAFTYFRNQSIAPAYGTISGGWADEAMNDLGGSTTEQMSAISDASDLFSQVATLIASNQAVEFGTNDSAGPLVNEHEYSVVATRVEAGVQEIMVRNPWGRNQGFQAKSADYLSTNNGYMWVKASDVYPQLDEVASGGVNRPGVCHRFSGVKKPRSREGARRSCAATKRIWTAETRSRREEQLRRMKTD